MPNPCAEAIGCPAIALGFLASSEASRRIFSRGSVPLLRRGLRVPSQGTALVWQAGIAEPFSAEECTHDP